MKVYAIIEEDYLTDDEGSTVAREKIVKLFSTLEKAKAFKHNHSADSETYQDYLRRRREWNEQNPKPNEENNRCPRDGQGYLPSFKDPVYKEWRANLDHMIYQWKESLFKAVGPEPLTYYYDIKEMEVE
jgi:hypothetical protein